MLYIYNLGRKPKNEALGFGVNDASKTFLSSVFFDFDKESLKMLMDAPVYR